jgi:hypothetical protein
MGGSVGQLEEIPALISAVVAVGVGMTRAQLGGFHFKYARMISPGQRHASCTALAPNS